MSDHLELKRMLIENEGNVEYLYLDTVGRVTVGVGHMVAEAGAAQQIGFITRDTSQPATAQRIFEEFSNVARQRPAMAAGEYRQFTQLIMTPAAVDALLDKDIEGMEAGVRANFQNYNSYPGPAQDALLDMAFNLGVHGLVAHFPHLKAAAEAQDWNTCAAQCHRNGIGDARNQKTAALFQMAAGA
jgi:GH24 family phage-related lysozyme (muramidase)